MSKLPRAPPEEQRRLFDSLQSKPPLAPEKARRLRSSLQDQSNKARVNGKVFSEPAAKFDNRCGKKRQWSDFASADNEEWSSGLLKREGQVGWNCLDAVDSRYCDTFGSRPGTSDAITGFNKTSPISQMSGPSFPIMPRVNMNICPLPNVRKEASLEPVKERTIAKGRKKPETSKAVNGVNKTDPSSQPSSPSSPNMPRVDMNISSLPNARREPSVGPGKERILAKGSKKPGASNTISGVNKRGPSSQVIDPSSQIMPRIDVDTSFLTNARGESSVVPGNKERIVPQGKNKLNVREVAHVGSESLSMKEKASCAPKTGSGVVMTTSSWSPCRPGAVDGWDEASCQIESQPLTGVASRKRSLPTRASSLSVAQWVGQRPQKISRNRRANVVSPVSNFEEARNLPEGHWAHDTGLRLPIVESSGLLLPRAIPKKGRQLKSKFKNLPSPACMLENEDSSATDNTSTKKGINIGDAENGILNVVHEMPIFAVPAVKNKASLKEDIADDVRRQRKSGRDSSVQTMSNLLVPRERIGTMGINKLNSAMSCTSDKSESKASDRKASILPVQTVNSSPSDLTGEADDDWEELLAAANAARNARDRACSSTFWKKMEPLFAFPSSEDINHVKLQINFADELDGSPCAVPDADCNAMEKLVNEIVPSIQSSFPIEQVNEEHGTGLHKSAGMVCDVRETRRVKTCGKLRTRNWSDISLSQRLLSAFIAEDGPEMINSIDESGISQLSRDCAPYLLHNHVEIDPEADIMKSNFELDSPWIGFDEPSVENDVLVNTDSWNLLKVEQRMASTGLIGDGLSECQYEHMSLDDRILMELHSIGLFSDTVPDLYEGEEEEDINDVIPELQMKLYPQVRKKKIHLLQLEEAIQDTNEMEERNLEQLAMNELVETANNKLTAVRESHGSRHTRGSSKGGKEVVLAFAKRTLARSRKFEETGRSCFNEPNLRDVVFSAPLYRNIAKCIADVSSRTAGNMNVDSHRRRLRSWASGSRSLPSGTTPIGEKPRLSYKRTWQLNKINHHGVACMSEQDLAKNDQNSNRRKTKEVLLDEIATSAVSAAARILKRTSPNAIKQKRTGKYKGQNKDRETKTSAKGARTPLSNGKDERKMKTKAKQKITHLSTTGNGFGTITETPSSLQDGSNEVLDIGFPLAETDEADELGKLGGDIGTWFNIADDALADTELEFLSIPMDDLSDLKLTL